MEHTLLISLIVLMAIFKTCSSAYNSNIPTFNVGSNLLLKNTPQCPCEEVNSTFHRSCGVSPKVSGINITDNGTHFGEFPWQVAIIEKYEDEFVCSGVLLSSRVVLTAAHCVQEIPVSQIKVRLGEWDILSEDKNPFETYGSLDIPVSKKYLNTETRSLNEAYNLAILKLAAAINFDEYPHVTPICLPLIMPGKAILSECMVTGWTESSVQTLEKLIQTCIGNLIPQSMGIWKHPVVSASDHCQLSDGNYKDSEECSPELSGIMGHENSFHYQQDGDNQFYGETINFEDEKTESQVFSRILSKSGVMVLSRAECLKVLKKLNSTLPKSNQLCAVAKKGSSPCFGDIGSPVICRVAEEMKQNLKEMKRKDEISLKYAVVGVITQSYSCTDNDSNMDLRPLLFTSISKSLDQICHVMSSN